jgi:ferredoxin-NADP reductase
LEQTIKLQITRAEMLTRDIRRLELSDPDGKALPSFAAGAHLRLKTDVPAGDPWRNYSLVNAAEQGRYYEIAVLREPGGRGGSLYMCDRLRVGDVIVSHLPKNDFALSAGATKQVLIAGGIGVTPILAMAEKLASAGGAFEFHYSCKRPDQMAFRDRALSLPDINPSLYFDGGDPSKGIDLAAVLGTASEGRHAYICGPRGMIDAAISTARSLGWREENLHLELFSAPAVQDGNRPIEVLAKASNRRVLVPPDRSILDCLIDAGLDPLFDCKRGECGACVTAVLDGVPEHRDYVLDEETRQSGRSMCICVSRAKSSQLVLDI